VGSQWVAASTVLHRSAMSPVSKSSLCETIASSLHQGGRSPPKRDKLYLPPSPSAVIYICLALALMYATFIHS